MLSRTGHVQAAGFCFAVCQFNTYRLTQNTQHINPVTCLPPTIIITMQSRSQSWQNLTRSGITADSCTQLGHTEVVRLLISFTMSWVSEKNAAPLPWWPWKDKKESRHTPLTLSFLFFHNERREDLSPFISAHNRFQELCFRGAAASYRGTTCFCSPQCFTSRQMRELAGK